MKRLFLIDFDRSLFDTARFQNDLTLALTEGNAAEQKQFIESIPQFSDPATGFYDFFEHATARTGLTHSQLLDRLQTGIGETDYTFADARDWIASRSDRDKVVIVSVGGPDYQALKFKYAPSLGHITRHVIKENKSLLLKQELNHFHTPPYSVTFTPGRYDEIFLVDDATAHLKYMPDLPGVSGIHLARPGGKYSHHHAPSGMRTISNLGELT